MAHDIHTADTLTTPITVDGVSGEGNYGRASPERFWPRRHSMSAAKFGVRSVFFDFDRLQQCVCFSCRNVRRFFFFFALVCS